MNTAATVLFRICRAVLGLPHPPASHARLPKAHSDQAVSAHGQQTGRRIPDSCAGSTVERSTIHASPRGAVLFWVVTSCFVMKDRDSGSFSLSTMCVTTSVSRTHRFLVPRLSDCDRGGPGPCHRPAARGSQRGPPPAVAACFH
jgi:hypothetical protein